MGRWKKFKKSVGGTFSAVAHTVKGPIASVAKDAKAAVVWGAKSGLKFAEAFTPGGLVKAFSSPGGFGLIAIMGLVAIGGILLLSKK